MQTILAIETSVANASIALWRDGELLQRDFESHRQQNQRLFPPLQELLDTLEGESIDTILIGTGPGSYSGARISIAAAQGIATVHQSQLAGICSFYAIEGGTLNQSVAVGDARRGSYFHYDMSRRDLLVKPTLSTKGQWLESLAAFPPSSLFTFETQTELPIPNIAIARPTASGLIKYWQQLSLQHQQELSSFPLEPLYLRAPFITKSNKPHPLIGK